MTRLQRDRASLDRFSIVVLRTAKRFRSMGKDTRLFDIIVLAGMVVNIILAVFLLVYYFDLL